MICFNYFDVHKSNVRLAMLYGREARCLKESEMGILRRTERSMVTAMCGVLLKDRKISSTLMFMLGLNETIDQLAMASNSRWYGHILRRALDFEVEGQRKKGRPMRTWKKQVEEESVKVGLRRKDALCRSKWSVDVNQIAVGLRCIWPPSHVGDTTRF